jgi:hypothetical protein
VGIHRLQIIVEIHAIIPDDHVPVDCNTISLLTPHQTPWCISTFSAPKPLLTSPLRPLTTCTNPKLNVAAQVSQLTALIAVLARATSQTCIHVSFHPRIPFEQVETYRAEANPATQKHRQCHKPCKPVHHCQSLQGE